MSDWMDNPPKSVRQQYELAKNALDPIEKPIEREQRPGVLGQFDKAATSSVPAQSPAKEVPAKTQLKTPLSFPSPGMRHNMKTPLGREVTAAGTAEAISKEDAAKAKQLNESIQKTRGNVNKTLDLKDEQKNRDDRSK